MLARKKTAGVRRGAAAVEFAFVLPVLLVLLVLMWDLGQLIRGLQVVSIAARESGRQASTGARSLASIRASALDTLTQNGIAFNAADPLLFNYTNITHPAVTDPMLATQNDELAVSVSVNFSQMKFASSAAFWGNRINLARAGNTSNWRSMRDLPVTIPWNIPSN
jgi:Flp pilus assembly protein TadG